MVINFENKGGGGGGGGATGATIGDITLWSSDKTQSAITEAIENQKFKTVNGETIRGVGNIQIDIPSLDGYATEEWVESQGYLTEHQPLDEYAKTTAVTEAIEDQKFKTINGETITGEGDIFVAGGDTLGYTLYLSPESDKEKQVNVDLYQALKYIPKEDYGRVNIRVYYNNSGQTAAGVINDFNVLADGVIMSYFNYHDARDEAYQGSIWLFLHDLVLWADGSVTHKWSQIDFPIGDATVFTPANKNSLDWLSKRTSDGSRIRTSESFLVDGKIYTKYYDINAKNHEYVIEVVNENGQRVSRDVYTLATEDWVEGQGYLTEHQSLAGYATQSWVKDQGYIKSGDIPEGVATQSWVNEQGFLKEHQSLVEYAKITAVTEAIEDQKFKTINGETITGEGDIVISGGSGDGEKISKDGYTINANRTYVGPNEEGNLATEAWVEGKHYLTEHQSLDGYATESWVNDKQYATQLFVTNGYLPLSGGTLTGHLTLGDANTTAFKKVETIRKTDTYVSGAAFYVNSDGTAAFFHKNYNGATATNDAILKFDATGLQFAKGGSRGNAAVDFHNVLFDNSLKTINGETIIGEGDIVIKGGSDYQELILKDRDVIYADHTYGITTPHVGAYRKFITDVDGGVEFTYDDYFYRWNGSKSGRTLQYNSAKNRWEVTLGDRSTTYSLTASTEPILLSNELSGVSGSTTFIIRGVEEEGLIAPTTANTYIQGSLATEAWVNEQGFLKEHQSLAGYATETWVNEQGFLKSGDMPEGVATQTWVNEQGFLKEQSLDGYATENWVEGKNYLTGFTETDPTVPAHVKAITTQNITNWNNKSDFSGSYNDLTDKPTIPSLDGYATESWVEGKNYLTGFTETDPTVPAHVKAITQGNINTWNNKSDFSGDYNDLSNKPTIPSLDGYATESWVEGKHYLTEHQSLANYYTKADVYNKTEINTMIGDIESILASI